MVIFTPNFVPNVYSPSCFVEHVTYKAATLMFDFNKFKLGGRVVVSSDLCVHQGCDLC